MQHSPAFKGLLSKQDLKAILLNGYVLLGAEPVVECEDARRNTLFSIGRMRDGAIITLEWEQVRKLALPRQRRLT